MTLKEIYETGVKDKELVNLLKENGWNLLDLFSWMDFARSQGYIK